jgi:hypothetical protein
MVTGSVIRAEYIPLLKGYSYTSAIKLYNSNTASFINVNIIFELLIIEFILQLRFNAAIYIGKLPRNYHMAYFI